METAGRFLSGSWGCLFFETWEGGKLVFCAIAATPDQFWRLGLAVECCCFLASGMLGRAVQAPQEPFLLLAALGNPSGAVGPRRAACGPFAWSPSEFRVGAVVVLAPESS